MEIPSPPLLTESTPDDFLIPGADESLFLVPDQSVDFDRMSAPQMDFLSLSDIADHRLRTYGHFWRLEKWAQAVVVPTLLAVGKNVTFDGKYIGINGKYFLSGAAASRLRNEYALVGPKTHDASADFALTEHLRQKSFEVTKWPADFQGDFAHLDFIVQAKNFHNYYHFTRETLHYLTLYKKFGLAGRILMVRSDKSDFPFVHQSIEAWFPDIADRVEYLPQLHTPIRFEQALLPFTPLHYYFQCRDRVIPSITDVGVLVRRRPMRANIRALETNSCESSLIDLSKLAHHGVADTKRTRRIYVQRKSGRTRQVVNGDLFFNMLERIGFEKVHFEDYSVAQQADLVAQCQAVVGLHGAGLANMVYAARGCRVIELSNLQTIRARLGDFDGFAMASGAHYHHLVLDHDFEDDEDPNRLPRIARDGHRGVVFSPFTAKVAASYIHALLYPDDTVAIFLRAEGLSKEKDKSELVVYLHQNGDKLAHIADTHVWCANIATDNRDRSGVLHHLRHALVLAPKRPALVRRILAVAHELRDDAAIAEAALHMRRYWPDDLEPLFNEKGWPLPFAMPIVNDDDVDEEQLAADLQA